MIQTRSDWAEALHRAAEPVVARHPLPQGNEAFFVNGSPIRAAHDPFLAWRRRRHGEQSESPSEVEQTRGDALLWACLLQATSPLAVLQGKERQESIPASLFPQSSTQTIEVWTEQELSSMHALWWIVRTSGDDAAARLLGQAIEWHIEHTQPDNATNRPWGIHVFAERGLAGDTRAMLYAETLLHNALCGMGEPEPFSAHILMDAADGLRMDQA